MLDKLSSFAAENPERFAVHLFVDSTDEFDESNHRLPPLRPGPIGKPAIERCLCLNDHHLSWWASFFEKPKVARPLPQKTLFLVCGPEP
jgi:cytochrome-b5 reductase